MGGVGLRVGCSLLGPNKLTLVQVDFFGRKKRRFLSTWVPGTIYYCRELEKSEDGGMHECWARSFYNSLRDPQLDGCASVTHIPKRDVL